MLFVVCGVVVSLFAIGWLIFVARCVLRTDSCMLPVAGRSLRVVGWLSLVVCRLLFVVVLF